jgi:hypothetical protein
MKKQNNGGWDALCCRKAVLISVDRQLRRRGFVGVADFIDDNNHNNLSVIAVSSGKRRLYQVSNLNVTMTIDKTPTITSTTTTTTTTTMKISKRRRPSLLLLTSLFILATAECVSSAPSSSFGISGDIDNNDHEINEAFWQDGAIDDDKIHPLLSMEEADDDEFEKRDSNHTFERTPSLRRRRRRHQQQQVQNESSIQREQHPHSSSLLRQKQQQSMSREQQQQQKYRQLEVEREQERNRKDRIAADFHFPSTTSDKRHRILIECSNNHYGEVFQDHRQYSQDTCVSDLLSLYGGDGDGGKNNTNHNNNLHNNHIDVIHNLESIHAISIEVDTQTLTDIVLDGKFVYHNDFVRRPLVIEGSMGYYNSSSSLSSSTMASNNNRNLLTEYQEIPWGLSAIKAQEVWEGFGVKGEGVKVCILDTGIQASHEDFRESHLNGYYGNEFISPYWYEDSKGHGTHVAGTITASDNSIGIV